MICSVARHVLRPFSQAKQSRRRGGKGGHRYATLPIRDIISLDVDEEEELLYGDLSEVLRKEARWVAVQPSYSRID